MSSAKICFAMGLIFFTSCRSIQKKTDASQLQSSGRTLSITDKEIEGIKFDFCPNKKSFSLTNALWLNYFAANQYIHFKELGPKLENLGFGDKGEGNKYRQLWYELRIKRISENHKDTDDTWKSEDERLARLEAVKAEYQEFTGESYQDDKVSASDLEYEITNTKNFDGNIQFVSGMVQGKDGKYKRTSTQAFYAENSKNGFSIIAFRGTETDQGADVIADMKLMHKDFYNMGKVHNGFYSAYLEVEDQILKVLTAHASKHPIKLWLTGHSLGAAISTIFTARLMLLQEAGQLKNVQVMGNYNIGSPRVGDDVFAEKFDELLEKYQINFVRFRNHKDLVTGIPFGMVLTSGFWHVGALAYFDAQGKLFYGDGWEHIEKDSDIKDSYPKSPGDHSSSLYWQNIKKAYVAMQNTEETSCAVSAHEHPLKGFKENPKFRK
ncbi:MAG: lipase family protein [Proteobacteria bacterium]|nr:lipase family protein [Pseudomonadota bacterium]